MGSKYRKRGNIIMTKAIWQMRGQILAHMPRLINNGLKSFKTVRHEKIDGITLT